jgi:hypothetical protein
VKRIYDLHGQKSDRGAHLLQRSFQDLVEQRREVCSLFHRFPAGWHGERLCVLLFGSEAHFFVKQQALKDLSGTLGTRTRRRIFAQGECGVFKAALDSTYRTV